MNDPTTESGAPTVASPQLHRAYRSLEGLSVGDAFGECFFIREAEEAIALRTLHPRPWRYTDDTQMALSVFYTLRECGGIQQEHLASSLAERYDSSRGYGASMRGLCQKLREGDPWQVAAPALFGGCGSLGNGAAMRVAPVGAFYAEDVDGVVAEHAARSAAVTHSHPEAVAGAVAVALATAWAHRLSEADEVCAGREFLDRVLTAVPESVVRQRLRHARDLPHGCSVALAVSALGNGLELSAPDTVPYALWCAAQHLDDFQEALWLTVSGLGDRDTTCAIVGGIVALSAQRGIPASWLESRELLPSWPFGS